MLFNSHEFLFLFLPLALSGYWALNRARLPGAALYWLVLASFVFYGWWNPAFLPLFGLSIAANYFFSRLILRHQERGDGRASRILAAGIGLNLLVLGHFKYSAFLAGSLAALFGQPHEAREPFLPLAISFFTIQQIVFLVDSYQGLCPKVSPVRYAAYVSFFPHLIAGPIVLHNELIPQLESLRTKLFRSRLGALGLFLLGIGLLKKIAVADPLAPFARQAFEGSPGFIEAWGGSLAYTMQLYFDFSGYSDMAVGIALLFGLELPVNFRSPYRARSIIQFWQNWHITLSRFITNYLYVPILKCFPKIDFRNSMLATGLAMLIAGLWHGADWRFLVFGGMHGAGLVANHLWKKRKRPLPGALAWGLTFFWVNLAFVFFRAPGWDSVGRMLCAMFLPRETGSADPALAALLLLAFGIALLAPNTEELARRLARSRRGLLLSAGLLLALGLICLEFENANEFLYFKF